MGSGDHGDYLIGYEAGAHDWMVDRSASLWASFFIRYLEPGMRLIDCGCGPGSITLGLAGIVAPGEVVGVDVEPQQIERARVLAERAGVTNVRFEVGSIYALPFPGASFDAAFAANVLEHLPDPLTALREMRRVLRPGGVVGVRDPDGSTQRIEGLTPEWQTMLELIVTARREMASPDYAPRQRALLRQAGFTPGAAFAFAECESTPEALRPVVGLAMGYLNTAASKGWVDPERHVRLRAQLEAWPDQPDALRAITHFAAVGRVPEA